MLSFDGDALDRYWLADYVPELMAVERRRYPLMETLRNAPGAGTQVHTVPIPRECADGEAGRSRNLDI